MLPFLKKKEGSMSTPVEEHEDQEYTMLDAIAEDMCQALEERDSKMLKHALEAFCEYIRDEIADSLEP